MELEFANLWVFLYVGIVNFTESITLLYFSEDAIRGVMDINKLVKILDFHISSPNLRIFGGTTSLATRSYTIR